MENKTEQSDECTTCGSPFCPGDEPHAFFDAGLLMTDEEMAAAVSASERARK